MELILIRVKFVPLEMFESTKADYEPIVLG
jgi:hypothetical protein